MSNYSPTELLPFANSKRQLETLKTVIAANGSQSKAAKKLGVSRQRVHTIMKNISKVALSRLYSPDHGLIYPVQEGFTGDYTLQRGPDGELERTWIKGKADKDARDKIHEAFVEGLAAEIKPAKPVEYKTNAFSTDLVSAVIFGDAHLGMLAELVETMADEHDLDIATKDIRLAIDYLVSCAPASEEGWFINVGDFVHACNSEATTHAGTRVDVAARQYKTLRAAGTVIRYCIASMLTKFKYVKVINSRGNHDNDAAWGINFYLEAVYENEPRVTVIPNDAKFQFLEFGKNLIGINHGDKININRLAGVMTKFQAEAWGRTTFRRWWMGHIHHKQAVEHDSGVTIESFHTLAPVDAWHSASGYSSERRVTMITLHKEFGEVSRMAPSIELVRAQEAA